MENAPVSEATRGVVAVLKAFGLPTNSGGFERSARSFLRRRQLESHIANVFKLAGISEAVMTNDPLDPAEAPLWENERGRRMQLFHAVSAARPDSGEMAGTLAGAAGDRDTKWMHNLAGKGVAEVRRFLADWCGRMKPVYMAVSLLG